MRWHQTRGAFLSSISNEPKQSATAMASQRRYHCADKMGDAKKAGSTRRSLHVTHVHIEDEYYLDSNPSFTRSSILYNQSLP